MNISLVFPPYVSFSCVPIGIASLKAYVERELPRATVNLLDLNVLFVHRVLSGEYPALGALCREAATVCQQERSICRFLYPLLKEQRELFAAAKTIMTDRALFTDRVLFDRYVVDAVSYVREVNYCLRSILKRYIERKLSSVTGIEDFFAPDIAAIAALNPDAVGFSVLVDHQLEYAVGLAKLVKQRLRVPVIFGGPALFNFDVHKFMGEFECIDFMVRKEGESALLELLKPSGERKDLQRIPNLVWRDGSRIVANPCSFALRLDDLPCPDYEGLPLDGYLSPEPVLPLATSKNCPWGNCRFCALNDQYDTGYKVRSIRSVIEDMKNLKARYGVRNFFFTDSDMPAARLRELGKALLAADLNIGFSCYVRPTADFSEGDFPLLRAAGARLFIVGVETLSDRGLAIINKGTSTQSIDAFFSNARSAHIDTVAYMLAFFPGQSEAEVAHDMKRMSELQRRFAVFRVQYSHYVLGLRQKFYLERDRFHIMPQAAVPYFFMDTGACITRNDSVPLMYAGAAVPEANPAAGLRRFMPRLDIIERWENYYSLNGTDGAFTSVINDFFFETMVLAESFSRSGAGKGSERSAYLDLYRRKKIQLTVQSYKVQVKGCGVSADGEVITLPSR